MTLSTFSSLVKDEGRLFLMYLKVCEKIIKMPKLFHDTLKICKALSSMISDKDVHATIASKIVLGLEDSTKIHVRHEFATTELMVLY